MAKMPHLTWYEKKRLGRKTREPMAALNRIPLRETGEPLVDLRRHCPGVRVSRKCIPFLRETVADMLNAAQASLDSSRRLWVRTALRTMAMQAEGYDGYFAMVKQVHPEWSHATLRRQTNRHFAPYDQKAPPGHCTGAAVDVWLLRPSGEPADLMSPYTDFWPAAYTFIDGLTPDAETGRATLYDAMTRAAFSNCEDEYWHYSYGDAAWAVRTGADHCRYGLVDAPKGWPSDTMLRLIREDRAKRARR